MSISQHKLIYEFSGSRNLNTNPLDVTELDGDKWDYMVEIEVHSGGGNSSLRINCNNDTTQNYRQYRMNGNGSSVAAYVSDAQFEAYGFTLLTTGSTVGRFRISGDSSSERYIESLHSGDSAGSFVVKGSNYWKNTVDNLTSIQLSNAISQTHDITLRIYQVPKQANLDNYDLVDVKSWSSESTTKSFTGLDGDLDKEYMIQWESDGSADVRVNNLSGSIYTRQRLTNSSGSIGANNATNTSYTDALYYNGQELTLLAETGRKRLFKSSASKTVSIHQSESACWVNNTVDNVTQIDIIPSGSITATAKLYKRKSNRSIDPVPMRTVVEHDINGVDFSAGITISGIEGDRIDGPIKIEFDGTIATTSFETIEVSFNSDNNTLNYSTQYLLGIGSSVQAGSVSVGTISNLILAYYNDTPANGEMYIYPKSGQNRPIMLKNNGKTSNEYTQITAEWWNNSVNELNEIFIKSNGTTPITGKIRVSVVKGTKQASPSFTVTVN